MSWGAGDASNAEDEASPLAASSGAVFTASSGDNGYPDGASYPASSKYVVGVGGTSLVLDGSGNRASETVWSGAGSGCSKHITKPSYQKDTGCSKRTVADVSAVAGERVNSRAFLEVRI